MLQFFCVQTEECCNTIFCCPIITPFESYRAIFFSSSSRSKENPEDFKKYLMNVSRKFSEFWPYFSRNLRENKTCAVLKYVYNPYTYILTKNWADIWHFANFVKSGWSDPKISKRNQIIKFKLNWSSGNIITRIEDCCLGYMISIARKITLASFCHAWSTGQIWGPYL